MAANALELEYEYVKISIKDGENRTKEYVQMHPAGKVPVIDDDGLILFESDAIIKYLASKHVSALYPDDLNQRALIDQWMDFTAIHVSAAMGRVVFNRIFAPFAKVPVDHRSLSDGLKFLKRFLPAIEQQLTKHAYLAGDDFSLADIALLATLDPAEVAEVPLSAHSRLNQWREDLRKKSFYTQCHGSYGEALKRTMYGEQEKS